MTYLFDTNICIYLLENRDGSLIRRISRLAPRSVAISTLTVAELTAGVALREQVESDMAVLVQFLSSYEILPFDLADAEAYGRVFHAAGKIVKRVNPVDGLLAAQGLARNLVLVTNDRKFPRVAGLTVDCWAGRLLGRRGTTSVPGRDSQRPRRGKAGSRARR